MNSDTTPRHPSSQRFADVLDEAMAVHDKKQRDYGRDDDPFANVRASEDFGIPDWVGCAIRMNDKIRRIQRAAQRLAEGWPEDELLANESLEDAFMDLLVYAGIGVVMLREARLEPTPLFDVKRQKLTVRLFDSRHRLLDEQPIEMKAATSGGFTNSNRIVLSKAAPHVAYWAIYNDDDVKIVEGPLHGAAQPADNLKVNIDPPREDYDPWDGVPPLHLRDFFRTGLGPT